MHTRWKRMLLFIGSGLIALLGTFWILIHSLGEHPRSYEGQPLNYWLQQAHSPGATVSSQALVVVQRTIIPQLTQQMFCDTNDSRLRLALVDCLNGLPGVTIYFTPADGRRAAAVFALGELGPAAKQAVPDLVKALKGSDPIVRGAAARALGRIRSEPDHIVPLLISLLDDPAEGVPEGAAEGLGEFGLVAKAALPKLLEASKSHDKDLQAAASVALKRIDSDGTIRATLK